MKSLWFDSIVGYLSGRSAKVRIFISEDDDFPAVVPIQGQADLDKFLQSNNAAGLCLVSSPTEVIRQFKMLDGTSVYCLRTTKRLEIPENWQRKENKIIDQEVAQCFLHQAPCDFGELKICPDLRRIKLPGAKKDDDVLQEWDCVVENGARAFVVEAKHSLRRRTVDQIIEKKQELDAILAATKIPGWEQFSRTELVIGASDFPDDVRSYCKSKGIMVIRPSGGRYCLE
jgi:hypothetical protein